MRGQVFTIEGKTFFTMGGAESTDKAYRKEGKSWWAGEMPSKEEMSEGVSNLDAVGKVDYILTHCAPSGLQKQLAYWYDTNSITQYLDFITKNYEFTHLYCGHYHTDISVTDDFTVVYNKIIEL